MHISWIKQKKNIFILNGPQMNLEIEEEIKIEKLYAVVEKNNSYFVELGK